MRKRGIAFLLLCSMVLQLAGCSGKPQTQEGTQAEVLTMYVLGSNTSYIQQVADAFNAENAYDVRIEIVVDPMDNYKLQLPVLAAANDLPDLFFTWEAGFLAPLVQSGKVLALSSLPEEEISWLDRFSPEALESLRFQGEIYAVPLQQSLTVVFYNREVFSDAGVKVPDTWEEFLELCGRLKDQGVTPLQVGSSAWQAAQLLTVLAAGVGGSSLLDSLIGLGPWQQAQTEQSLFLLESLYEMQYVELDASTSRLREGTVAMRLNGDWDLPAFQDDPQIGAFLLPAVDPSHEGTCIHSVDQCYAVSASCGNPEAACAFLEYLTNEENQRMLLLETGQQPGTSLNIETYSSSLQRDIFSLYNQIENSVIWIDRRVGGDVGEAFNQMAMAVLSGRDPLEELEAFRTVVERQTQTGEGGEGYGKETTDPFADRGG